MEILKVIDAPSQSFTVSLGGKQLLFKLVYNTVQERWSFDLDVDGVATLRGRRIKTGIDLFYPFAQLNAGILLAADIQQAGNEPNRANLPNGTVRVYHLENDEYEAATA